MQPLFRGRLLGVVYNTRAVIDILVGREEPGVEVSLEWALTQIQPATANLQEEILIAEKEFWWRERAMKRLVFTAEGMERTIIRLVDLIAERPGSFTAVVIFDLGDHLRVLAMITELEPVAVEEPKQQPSPYSVGSGNVNSSYSARPSG